MWSEQVMGVTRPQVGVGGQSGSAAAAGGLVTQGLHNHLLQCTQ